MKKVLKKAAETAKTAKERTIEAAQHVKTALTPVKSTQSNISNFSNLSTSFDAGTPPRTPRNVSGLANTSGSPTSPHVSPIHSNSSGESSLTAGVESPSKTQLLQQQLEGMISEQIQLQQEILQLSKEISTNSLKNKSKGKGIIDQSKQDQLNILNTKSSKLQESIDALSIYIDDETANKSTSSLHNNSTSREHAGLHNLILAKEQKNHSEDLSFKLETAKINLDLEEHKNTTKQLQQRIAAKRNQLEKLGQGTPKYLSLLTEISELSIELGKQESEIVDLKAKELNLSEQKLALIEEQAIIEVAHIGLDLMEHVNSDNIAIYTSNVAKPEVLERLKNEELATKQEVVFRPLAVAVNKVNNLHEQNELLHIVNDVTSSTEDCKTFNEEVARIANERLRRSGK